MFQFGTFSFYFSFETKIFNSLSDFSANIFLRIISCLQTIYFVFSEPANFFFHISYPLPLQKNNGPSLIDDELVNLIDSVSILGSPTQFVDVSVGEPQRPTTHFQLFLRQNSTSPSPLSLMVPQPCRKIASSLPAGVVTFNFSIPIRGNQ